jgi:hypothetical protein
VKIKKSDIIGRLEKMNAILGSWDSVADVMKMSRSQVFKYKNGEYETIKPAFIKKLEMAEKQSGITKSQSELLLRQMLTDRMAHLYSQSGHNAEKFEALTGIPLAQSNFVAGAELPAEKEIIRLASLGSENLADLIKKAWSAIGQISAAQKKIQAAQDELRNLIYHTEQKCASGLAEKDPLLLALTAFKNEKSG